MSAPDRRAIVGLQPKRAEVILAGACVVRTVMDKLSKESFVVSDRGLRHGLLDERFGPLERPAQAERADWCGTAQPSQRSCERPLPADAAATRRGASTGCPPTPG